MPQMPQGLEQNKTITGTCEPISPDIFLLFTTQKVDDQKGAAAGE